MLNLGCSHWHRPAVLEFDCHGVAAKNGISLVLWLYAEIIPVECMLQVKMLGRFEKVKAEDRPATPAAAITECNRFCIGIYMSRFNWSALFPLRHASAREVPAPCGDFTSTCVASMGQERFSSLALLHIH